MLEKYIEDMHTVDVVDQLCASYSFIHEAKSGGIAFDTFFCIWWK